MYEDDQEANMSFKRRASYQLFTKGKYAALQQWSKAGKQSAYLHLQFFLEQINWVYKMNHKYLASFIRVVNKSKTFPIPNRSGYQKDTCDT